MATLVPALSSCLSRMQAGERRFARRLEGLLEDDYRCWYDLPVGKRQRYADFIILHPLRGLLLLEVKDWKLETIHSIDKTSARIITPSGLKTVANPLEQARQCAYQLVDRLQRDRQLLHPVGPYKGRLLFPYGYGVVLTAISRAQFNETDLCDVLPEHQTICKDEMVEAMDPESFQNRLWGMFNVQFCRPLSLPVLDRIRWHLFPEVRISTQEQGSLFPKEANDEAAHSVPDLIKVMDMQQELLARSLGEGHRVIHGVAGSGKTLILGYRCLYLARLLNKPILVLCYNIALAARLRELVEDRGIGGQVSVYHFHDWCGEQLKTYHVPRPPPGDGYIERLVQSVVDAAEKGQIPRAQYGAVLVDEGHDFEKSWLELIAKMVNPETNSLLLLYDDAQSIYSKKGELGFALSSVGIQARGRTTVLKLNYRNTDEILTFAYRFARKYLDPSDADDDHVPLVEPNAVGRHGPAPVVRVFDSYAKETGYVAHLLNRLHEEQQVPWSDMCVTYRSRWMGTEMAKALHDRRMPVQWLDTPKAKRGFKTAHDSIKVMTMHSSKGLEFPVVAVTGVGYMPADVQDPAGDAKLLYVAMTRSTEKLLITSHRQTDFIRELMDGADGAPEVVPKSPKGKEVQTR